MATTSYKRTLLTGGTSEALDSIDGAGLLDGDFAFGLVGGTLYIYLYKDYGSAQSESSPELIVPDTNPENFAWQLQDQRVLDTITTDTTLYIATTGDDVTGDGTIGDPWYSLNAAFDYLKDKWINTDVTVTISIAAGTYTDLSEVVIEHPCASRIKISGGGSVTTILQFTANGITVKNITINTIEKIKLYSPLAVSNGLSIYRACVGDVNNVIVDNFVTGIYLYNSSSVNLTDCNLTAGVALRADDSSSANVISGVAIASTGVIGCYASVNSFINASGVTSNTATTPYDPATTTSDVEPTWGNYGSWILDV